MRFILLLIAASVVLAADKPNVLLIAVDDLNDWVSCLNGHPDTRTPNIDRLAKRGVLFTNAHCQAPICNPSRTSILSGLRPSTTGFYDNQPNSASMEWFTSAHVTLPRHFAANGYRTFTTGKLYHASVVPKGDFDVVGPRPGQWNDLDEVVQTTKPGHVHRIWDFGPQTYDENKFADYVDASWAMERLREKHEKPFLLTVGFYRPHVPFFSPERVYNSPDLADGVTLPLVKSGDRDDIPEIARQITYSPHPPEHAWMERNGNEKWKEAVRSYLAAIRWTDEQLGRLLDELDASPYRENTVVVLYADHGFHLGEKQRWAKWSLWERSTRVPLIVRVPGGKRGLKCPRPVELLSVYPTLIDVCGLSKNAALEGVSLAPLLDNPEADWPHAAITTLGRNNHAVRTERWRYIRYADGSEELYDHWTDPSEWTNLASDPELRSVVAELKKRLPTKNVAQVEIPKRK